MLLLLLAVMVPIYSRFGCPFNAVICLTRRLCVRLTDRCTGFIYLRSLLYHLRDPRLGFSFRFQFNGLGCGLNLDHADIAFNINSRFETQEQELPGMSDSSLQRVLAGLEQTPRWHQGE